MGYTRLFLSGVSDEFGDYREALRHELTTPTVEVKIQEDLKALGGDTLRMLEEYIRQCNTVVHLVGDMAGATPPMTSVDDLLRRRPALGPRLKEKGLTREALKTITYTHWEAWLAIGFEKRLAVFEPTQGAPRGPDFRPTDASRGAQAVHLERLRAIDIWPKPFTSADNLVAQVFPLLSKASESVYQLLIDNLAVLERSWQLFADLPYIENEGNRPVVNACLESLLDAGARVCAARDDVSAVGDLDTRKELDGLCETLLKIKQLTHLTLGGTGGIALARVFVLDLPAARRLRERLAER